jgi:hypothetical protein
MSKELEFLAEYIEELFYKKVTEKKSIEFTPEEYKGESDFNSYGDLE